MSYKSIAWPMLLVLLGALAFVAGRTRGLAEPEAKKATMPPRESQLVSVRSATAGVPSPRNLSLQPEAFKMGRRLGTRFARANRAVSVIQGTLTMGTERRTVSMVRRQTERGEGVEIALGAGPPLLTWSEAEGARSSGGVPTEVDRNLIERLALDSADQFVLAQLRGASYQTVARNVRPAEASGSDSYNGPIWDIVRVGEPEQDAQRRPRSIWRLYYINGTTGLIDKTVSDIDGQRIETNFVTWMTQAGETVPSRITWKYSGQILMEFRLLTFAHNPQF